MEIKNSYLVKLNNGSQAWLSINNEVPNDATIIEERPMLISSENMILHNINTNEYTNGIWLKDSVKEDWEEMTQEEYKDIISSIGEK